VLALWSLVVLIILLIAVSTPLGPAARYAGNSYGDTLVVIIALLPMAPVGFVVARRQPGNPIGWMFLALTVLLLLTGVGTDYAWLSYQLGHHLPLAAAGVFLGPGWLWLFLTLPLVILLSRTAGRPRPGGGRCCGATWRSPRAGW
jgi:hypothetical protein